MNITQQHIEQARKQLACYSDLDFVNAVVKIASEQVQYITAEEARALGSGNAEWFDDDDSDGLIPCVSCAYLETNPKTGEPYKCRYVKQLKPWQHQIDTTVFCPCMRKWADCTACKENLFGSEEEHRAKVWAEHNAKNPVEE